MKKAVINAAIMITMGAGLVFSTNAITPKNDIQVQDTGFEETVEMQRTDTDVELRKNSSEAEVTETAIEVSTEQLVEAPTEVLEETVVEPECLYPEWQNSVVADVEGSLRVREEASTDSEIVGKLYPYTVATIIEPGEEWTKIESGNVVGYVSNEYLMFGDDAGAYITEHYKYCATVEVQA